MDSVTLDYLKSVSSRLKTAPHGQKSAIVEQSAKFLNCSVKQVYTMLKQANLAPQTKKGGRKIRTDKGKTVITESQASLAMPCTNAVQKALSCPLRWWTVAKSPLKILKILGTARSVLVCLIHSKMPKPF